ncbi:MAG TPA: guanitoxin biosynthesis L-enduracididine beta-hydroxylase GntD [Blastocatellia bacterium]|nr:guanitoxin biosynthesis L-enduracididine beta-hydroxylase GntD [Blastocatellia bacterium]
MNRLVMTAQEIDEVREILVEIVARYDSVEDLEFHRDACIWAHRLPERIRRFINAFKLFGERSGLCMISGYPLDDAKIGKSPDHWKLRPRVSPALAEEALLVLFGSLLGYAFGWSTQQDGRLLHEVFPIKEHEDEQLGTGSKKLLTWHTEDAFHECRGDYIGLLCIRNPNRVATLVASIDMVELAEEYKNILFEPRFTIRPDESHLAKNNSPAAESSDSGGMELARFEQIERMRREPERASVLFGSLDSPFIRIDPYFMDRLVEDEKAQEALDNLIALVDGNLTEIVFEPGDFCFLDNLKAVHGRQPFVANYDGHDRWLKRINVTCDLRKSRAWRREAASRVMI